MARFGQSDRYFDLEQAIERAAEQDEDRAVSRVLQDALDRQALDDSTLYQKYAAQEKLREEEQGVGGTPPSLKVLILESMVKNGSGLHNRILMVNAVDAAHIEPDDKRAALCVKKIQELFVSAYPSMLERLGEELLLQVVDEKHLLLAKQADEEFKLVQRQKAINSSGVVLDREAVHLSNSELAAAGSCPDGRQYYPLKALVAGCQWPAGVDPRNRERHLAPTEFQTVFGMSRAAFEGLDKFKQVMHKKDKKLF